MIILYADLVELGLRVLENPQPGEIAVPAFLRADVKKELEKRASMSS
ncbi:CD1375 family protein [Cytobacillus solani]|nr:CD1375 family protein [Cytobacillus solani]